MVENATNMMLRMMGYSFTALDRGKKRIEAICVEVNSGNVINRASDMEIRTYVTEYILGRVQS
jgi:hypothetical protein